MHTPQSGRIGEHVQLGSEPEISPDTPVPHLFAKPDYQVTLPDGTTARIPSGGDPQRHGREPDHTYDSGTALHRLRSAGSH